MKPEEVETILNAVDTDNNGAINYTEFIAATLNNRILEDQKKLKKAFDYIDVNHDGTVDSNDIANVFASKASTF